MTCNVIDFEEAYNSRHRELASAVEAVENAEYERALAYHGLVKVLRDTNGFSDELVRICRQYVAASDHADQAFAVAHGLGYRPEKS